MLYTSKAHKLPDSLSDLTLDDTSHPAPDLFSLLCDELVEKIGKLVIGSSPHSNTDQTAFSSPIDCYHLQATCRRLRRIFPSSRYFNGVDVHNTAQARRLTNSIKDGRNPPTSLGIMLGDRLESEDGEACAALFQACSTTLQRLVIRSADDDGFTVFSASRRRLEPQDTIWEAIGSLPSLRTLVVAKETARRWPTVSLRQAHATLRSLPMLRSLIIEGLRFQGDSPNAMMPSLYASPIPTDLQELTYTVGSHESLDLLELLLLAAPSLQTATITAPHADFATRSRITNVLLPVAPTIRSLTLSNVLNIDVLVDSLLHLEHLTYCTRGLGLDDPTEFFARVLNIPTITFAEIYFWQISSECLLSILYPRVRMSQDPDKF
ncbi:hypothetical protein RQP46_007272 [Phenoliferia psychrophenolica]